MRKPPPDALDRIDRKLLALLQQDARLTQERLAEQIGLSASAVQRRIRHLEQIGVIGGYRAVVSPRALGLGLSALLSVRLEKHRASSQRSPQELFGAAVQGWPEVVECLAMTGEMDYLLRVNVQDMDHYAHFVLETLLKHESVEDVKSSFVLTEVKPFTGVSV
ncbi:Lrp/AsnC family transcriptional regulator [Thiomonas bhubaneswarensis]|uniref:Transcriptional regulator, AsnC family n=1 Tax=Thiomonas bhubaneswarensis TaxID=339866 RepID=A0A0K6I1X8_9BURK|nr:Lrp/AsnC family transcriptional regulator [Thiomonas bhubaneswarensis]CUA97130.1 transcriptional regulator, AsnC family [Thiomonas bhubaneswarensis]